MDDSELRTKLREHSSELRDLRDQVIELAMLVKSLESRSGELLDLLRKEVEWRKAR